ncbi:hypothetical protein JZ751_010724 [Albula glossodonta]|uniref:Uncharacterized protein n=1 Tax=Albula glossodonta TaxID=121402 RepID=A0A8T2MZR2_9TELE|nr:hypothetical protein JZ751_010724 [Albula glossodonta]
MNAPRSWTPTDREAGVDHKVKSEVESTLDSEVESTLDSELSYSVDSNSEPTQPSRDVSLHDEILAGHAPVIGDILRSRSADSPIHYPAGLLGKAHSKAFLPDQPSAIPHLHLTAIPTKERSPRSLLRPGAEPDKRHQRGVNAVHVLLAQWPKGGVPGPEVSSRFACSVAERQQQAAACLRLLCGSGLDLNAGLDSESRETALHLAVRYGALPAVPILASHGANVNTADRHGLMPLHMAVSTLNHAITVSLLQHGADPNAAMTRSGSTVLHMAVIAIITGNGGRAVDLSCIKALLDHGALPDTQNRAGRTALHEACAAGQAEVVDVLLSYGADVNVQTGLGENCLFLFLDREANLQRTALLQELLSLTCPLTLRNSAGLLPQGLLLPTHQHQTRTLLQLSMQPLHLQHLCRIHLRLRGRHAQPHLRATLPHSLYDFVYSKGVTVRCASPVRHERVIGEARGLRTIDK